MWIAAWRGSWGHSFFVSALHCWHVSEPEQMRISFQNVGEWR